MIVKGESRQLESAAESRFLRLAGENASSSGRRKSKAKCVNQVESCLRAPLTIDLIFTYDILFTKRFCSFAENLSDESKLS